MLELVDIRDGEASKVPSFQSRHDALIRKVGALLVKRLLPAGIHVGVGDDVEG